MGLATKKKSKAVVVKQDNNRSRVRNSGVLFSTILTDGTAAGTYDPDGAVGRGLAERVIIIPRLEGALNFELFVFDGTKMKYLDYGGNGDYFAEGYYPEDETIKLALFETRRNPATLSRYRVGIQNQNESKYFDFNLTPTYGERGGRLARINIDDFINGDMFIPPAGFQFETNRTTTVFIPLPGTPPQNSGVAPNIAEYADPQSEGEEILNRTVAENNRRNQQDTNRTGKRDRNESDNSSGNLPPPPTRTTNLTISPFMPCAKLFINNREISVPPVDSEGSIILNGMTGGNTTIKMESGDTPQSRIVWERTINITGQNQRITPDTFGYLMIEGFDPSWTLKIDNIIRTCFNADFHYATSTLGQKDIKIELPDGRFYSFRKTIVPGRNIIHLSEYEIEEEPLEVVDLINTGNTNKGPIEENPASGNTGNGNSTNGNNNQNPRRNTGNTGQNQGRDIGGNTTYGNTTGNTTGNISGNTNNTNNTNNTTNTTNTTNNTEQSNTQYGSLTVSGLPANSILTLTKGTQRKELRPDSLGNASDPRLEIGTWNAKVKENETPRASMDRTFIVTANQAVAIDYTNTTPEEVSRLTIYLNAGKFVVLIGPGGIRRRETPIRGLIELDGLEDGEWKVEVMQGNSKLETRTVRLQRGQAVELEIDPSPGTDIETTRTDLSEVSSEESGSNLIYWLIGLGMVGGAGYYYRKDIAKMFEQKKALPGEKLKK